MEIVRSQRRNGSDGSAGAASLPLYKSAPSLEVRLEEFERCAIDRLRVLKAISDGLSRGKKPEEMDNLVGELWRANMKHQDVDETLRKDIISHFALRLVYCREEEMRRWFLSMETTLFRYRFRLQNAEAQKSIMNELQLQYNVLSHAEYETLKDKLIQAARSVNSTSNPETVFYKVPFEDVPDLVAGRRVFLLKGFAFVPRNQVVSLVCTIFRSNISKALALTNRKWRATIHDQEKDRLAPIVEALGNSYLGPDYSQPRECAEISLKDINQLASSSFPLCMRHLFGKLKEDHHLKHGGRMQLGLFLKGVGLKLEDALAFWRAEFSQKVGAERFDKEYAYSIRHNYGKEGKRTDYTPYSCQKIIMSTPSTGDHHGCPFRHFSEENLRAALNKMGVGGRAMDDIMDKVRNRHYQLACTLTFEATHAASCETGINHPNQYFVESRKIFQSKILVRMLITIV
ncbi:putative DNA primase large subunit [Carex littledalei]|uniref:DNA primase large subunit n=1 Tax=Carex littledalei TaxID=544730 RepID=A0A833QK98_9POAL|nr:putative DNA primase large subunit [Carex littledalei]